MTEPNDPNVPAGDTPVPNGGIDETTKSELAKLGGNYSNMQNKATQMGFSSPEDYQKWLEDEAYRNIQADEDKALSQGKAPPMSGQAPPVQKIAPQQPAQPPPVNNQPAPSQQPVFDEKSTMAMLESQHNSYELNHFKNKTEPPFTKQQLMDALTSPAAAAIGQLAKSKFCNGNVWVAAEQYIKLQNGDTVAAQNAQNTQKALNAAQQAGGLGIGTSVAPPSGGTGDETNEQQIADEIAPAVGGYVE